MYFKKYLFYNLNFIFYVSAVTYQPSNQLWSMDKLIYIMVRVIRGTIESSTITVRTQVRDTFTFIRRRLVSTATVENETIVNKRRMKTSYKCESVA